MEEVKKKSNLQLLWRKDIEEKFRMIDYDIGRVLYCT